MKKDSPVHAAFIKLFVLKNVVLVIVICLKYFDIYFCNIIKMYVYIYIYIYIYIYKLH